MTQPTLYGHFDSGHVYQVRLALTMAQRPHHYVHIGIWQPHGTRPEPFRSLAPFGEVPLLVWDGQVYAQSDAILYVIAERGGVLGGESPQRLARAREWLFWEANCLCMALPQLRYAKRFAPEGFTPDAPQWIQTRFDKDIARLDQELARTQAFILDDKPSSPTLRSVAACSGPARRASRHRHRWSAGSTELPTCPAGGHPATC